MFQIVFSKDARKTGRYHRSTVFIQYGNVYWIDVLREEKPERALSLAGKSDYRDALVVKIHFSK